MDHAPPPSGVLWDNVGVTAASRFARLWAVNGAMFLGLVFVSSPLALFSFVNDAAKTLNPEYDFQWDQWVAWANGRGYLAGFVFQFLPNLGVLVVIYLLIPRVMERATRAERHHAIRRPALLVSKEFWFFLINLLLLLALGKAALSATVQQVRQCQWRTAPTRARTGSCGSWRLVVAGPRCIFPVHVQPRPGVGAPLPGPAAREAAPGWRGKGTSLTRR